MLTNDLRNKLRENLLFYFLLFLAGAFAYFSILLGRSISSSYLWLLAPSSFFAVLGYLEHRRLEKAKLLADLRREWGIEKLNKKWEFSEISALFEQATKTATAIDDRTWHDLNMDLVFSRLDRTFTWPGIQRLYQMLRSPEIENLDDLKSRATVISGFEKQQAPREEVQCVLTRMDARIGSGLCTLLWSAPEVAPVHPLWLYRIMFVLALLSPLLLLIDVRNFVAILLIFQVNMYLHFKVQKKIRSYFEGVRSLGQLIRVSEKLALLDVEFLHGLLSQIREALGEVKHYTRIIRSVGVETTDPLMNMFQQYYTIFFLAEVRGFFGALDYIREHREALQSLFLVVGEIDALQSTASYRVSLENYCEPHFVKGRLLLLEEAYHPLLKNPIPNSISVREQGVLITGSNMSGKSTFLRTVGLNVLLAQTIATCTARSYQACPVRLLTSIGRSDNVVEGKSYYLEEALSVLRVLDALNDETVTVVIFDELYRGTNSEERIFAAQRVLEYLIRRNSLVFVATHDLELTGLLSNRYASMHFSERVAELGLEFDYKLKKGPATTRNAIALLRYLGYPEEITNQD